MAARYVHYYKNFDKVVLNGDMLIPEFERRGHLVAEVARGDTPEGPGGEDGHIRDFYGVSTSKNGGMNNDRIETTVYNGHKRAANYELGHVMKNGTVVKAANKLSGALWAARS